MYQKLCRSVKVWPSVAGSTHSVGLILQQNESLLEVYVQYERDFVSSVAVPFSLTCLPRKCRDQ